jgi:hypothetical protein
MLCARFRRKAPSVHSAIFKQNLTMMKMKMLFSKRQIVQTILFILGMSMLCSRCTCLSRPKTLEIIKPQKSEAPALYNECSQMLNLILDDQNQLKYYSCTTNGQAGTLAFSSESLKQLILKRQAEVVKDWGDKDKLVILVRATRKASFKHMETTLDLIQSLKIKQYALVDLDKTDSTVFQLK